MHAIIACFLGHPYPRVRQHAALQLHLLLLSYAECLCPEESVRGRLLYLLSLGQQHEASPVLLQVSALLGFSPGGNAKDDDDAEI
jgi:hypothetical protein